MPSWLLIFGIIMATGAAIIASQALISGCFTIFSEAVHLDFWPMLRIKYPSEVKGQLFIPIVNNALYPALRDNGARLPDIQAGWRPLTVWPSPSRCSPPR
jgi:hypothetical protein